MNAHAVPRDIADALGSSLHAAGADDRGKDDDNLLWLRALPRDVQRAWEERLRWIRITDRMAESELLDPTTRPFAQFLAGWRYLRRTGRTAGPHADELETLRALWLAAPEGPPRRHAIDTWDAYLTALDDYHAPGLVLRTLAEHDEMLWRLSGRIFQLLPYVPHEFTEAIGEFGRLDQFFNNLRDLHEDAERGLCFLPVDVLARFGVERDEVIAGRAVDRPGWAPLMRWWLDDHRWALWARADPFIEASGLHPSLELMRAWCLWRYARIERVMRAVGCDPRRFQDRYWAATRHELQLVQGNAWRRSE